jgi:hypothetical protein
MEEEEREEGREEGREEEREEYTTPTDSYNNDEVPVVDPEENTQVRCGCFKSLKSEHIF